MDPDPYEPAEHRGVNRLCMRIPSACFLRYRIFTGYCLTKPEILRHTVAMRIDHITSNHSHAPAVPAFNFLFASAEPKTAKRRSSLLTRPALRSKRV